MGQRDKRIDAYIAKAGAFAQPMMSALREMVHETCPDVVETVKWSRPGFDYNGLLCGMDAFKAHMSFRFWLHAELVKHATDAKTLDQLNRMESVTDLPSRSKIVTCIKHAMALNDAGVKLTRRVSKVPKAVVVPEELAAALAKKPKAQKAFDAMSPSCRREYSEWVAGAKRDETKATRVEKAIAQVLEGKSLNWKYERK